jgi:hypothetical protein
MIVILLSTLFAVAASSTVPATCLEHLQHSRSVMILAYDHSHDKHGDSSISCNFGLTASEANDDLRAIVDAARTKGCKSLVSVSNAPLSIQFRGGHEENLSKTGICREQLKIRRFITDNSALFSVEHLDLLGWRGAFLGSERILINTVADGRTRPHLKIVALGSL